jgi:hypothetical protein
MIHAHLGHRKVASRIEDDQEVRPKCYPTSGLSGLLLSWVPDVTVK